MKLKYRTQNDNLGDELSILTGIDCSNDKDMARQEAKDDADINIMLSRFGVNHQQRTLTFGEQDYTIDLQQGLAAIEQTKRVYHRMADEIKAIYPNFEKFVQGMRTGAVAKDLERIDQAKMPEQERQAVQAEIRKERTKAQVLRDEEAANVAEQIKKGERFEKPKEPQKSNT